MASVDSCDKESSELWDFQERADSALRGLGLDLPKPLTGESLNSYRYRVLVRMKRHSPDFKAADLSSITDPAMMRAVETRILADAATAGQRGPEGVQPFELREVKRRDSTGRTISTFYGSGVVGSSTFIAGMRPAPRYISGIDMNRARPGWFEIAGRCLSPIAGARRGVRF